MQPLESPSVSVVILAYNEEATIARCLASIVSQCQEHDEVVVVNNNSTDRTAEIVRQFPVRMVDEARQGFTPARNRGFDEACHNIMVRFDADGVMPEGWLEAVRAIFIERPYLLGASGPVYYHDLKNLPRMAFPFPGNQLYMKMIGFWPTLVGPNMVVTKQAWRLVRDELHHDDRLVHEDMDLSIHIRQYGEIAYDHRLELTTSARRMVEEPSSFFFEYPMRNIRTMMLNWPHLRRARERKLAGRGTQT